MSTRKQDNAVEHFQQIWQLSKTNFKQQMHWLLRGLLVIGRQRGLSGAGFVLPTVAMVSLVIVLLTTALLVRAFDRSKYASNVRVNEAVLNAATPALARARAKLDALFSDPTLLGETPSDLALYNALTSSRYSLGDETGLKLVSNINNNGGIQRQPGTTYVLENDETLTTAWRFPVDTDNNGKFDSYTLYSIHFRSPSRNENGQFNTARNPLEARTPPMAGGAIALQCTNATGTSTNPVGDSDWYKSGSKLIKSFFVYTATVPISNLPTNPTVGTANDYETTGNKAFSALEFQQDRVRIPLNNNALWYEDDIEVSNATTVRLNGRVFTNSNLMVAGKDSSNKVIFYQVSDPDSCYYEQENSKIVIAGNVANGDVRLASDEGGVEVHRFQGKGTAAAGQNTDDGISSTNKTTTQTGGKSVGYNNRAYSSRIGLMVQAALNLHGTAEPTLTSVSGVTRYPQEVKERFLQRFNDSNETKELRQILTEELETYFKAHTRRVPYNEVDTGSVTAVSGYTAANVLGSTDPIRPPDTWMAIEAPTTGSTTGYTNLPLSFGNNTMNLRATEPKKQQKDGKEHFIGDRIRVGNNLPFFWPQYTTGTFNNFAQQVQQLVKNNTSSVYWNNPSNGNATSIERTRQSQIQILPDLGSVDRDGFWETEAAKQPFAYENTGGLRVVTGAGVYIDGVAPGLGGTGVRGTDSFLPAPALIPGVTDPIVWSDSMPMWDGSKKGDLQMRATAVYHYKQGIASTTPRGQVDPNQVPIACVSNYYDPTDQITARNGYLSGVRLPDVSGISDTNGDGNINDSDKLADGSTPSPAVNSNNGKSNNGVTYYAPYTDDAGRTSAITTYRAKLDRQARAIFPTGRIVNEPLRKALINYNAYKPRSLADNAAIDTAICSMKILDGTLSIQTSPNIPHGAIKEATFLDARQVKSLNNFGSDNTRIAETRADFTGSYTLPLEQRQPLEIRVTELDLNLLKTKAIGTPTNSTDNNPANNQEYLLPNSGIIYATRDDALPDLSDSSIDPTTQALVSSTDFKLDSTRRPNGIRLINGSNLARKNFYRVAEKGLILATNLPTYIKGNFNLHKDPSSDTVREEFTDTLENDWSDFYTRATSVDNNFACRTGQPGCGSSGDQWRSATIISDAQTLLSKNFWDGFRNQGDYDLNNNQGNSAVDARLKSGFWNNNFVSSANWAGSNGYPSYKNSYLTNGVTPIQRRVDNFPEYIMEVCRVIPASECKPTDWVVGYDLNGNGNLDDVVSFDVNGDGTVNSNDTEKIITANQLGKILASAIPAQTLNTARLGAGTTAISALVAADQRYARRVAFARSQFHALVFTQIGSGTSAKNAAKPLGVGCPLDDTGNAPENNGCKYPDSNTWTAGTHYGTSANNALWFRTTNNITGSPGASADITYANNRPLYYLPPELGGEKLILPETPDIPGVTSLNGSGNNDPSDYTMCITSGSGRQSKQYLVTELTGSCSINLNTQVEQLLGLTSTGTLTGNTQTIDASPSSNINVYTLPAGTPTINNGAIITLNGNADSIFVFQGDSSVTFGSNPEGTGITLVLNGVNPNNIFWVTNSTLDINNATAAQPHKLAGNFIGKSSVKIGTNTEINGGRFLNFTSNPGGIPATSKLYAVTSNGQPSLVPVLQIHSPTGTPGSNPFAGALESNWLQVAGTTIANAAFITGDSPSRPTPSESGGGLPNLVRFLENWSSQTARISGSFIQYKRSSYSSAPFNPVDPTITDPSASLFYTLDGSNKPAYSSDTGFRYRGGESEQRSSFYMQATRAWGFDVALLSQSPDLFAQKLTQQPVARPDEFFREVNRDDSWVQTLLCAASASDRVGGSGATYTNAAIDARPSTCPINLPYPANPS